MSSTVLLAEDDPFNLKLLEEVCGAAGYRVLSAVDGSQVLDIVARERPDLVLLDVNMPGMDGFEVLQVLKSDPVMSSIPVLMMTAVDDIGAKQRGIELGAEDYITKPYRVFEVQQRIKNTLKRMIPPSIMPAAEQGTGTRLPSDIRALLSTSSPQQLFIALNYEFMRAMRYGHALSCWVIQNASSQTDPVEDAPWFMATYRAIKACIRGTDHLFRHRPHEFVVLLPETDDAGAEIVGRRICELLKADPAIEDIGAFRCASVTYPTHAATSGQTLLQTCISAAQNSPALA